MGEGGLWLFGDPNFSPPTMTEQRKGNGLGMGCLEQDILLMTQEATQVKEGPVQIGDFP